MTSLVLHTSKPDTLFDNIHELGACFHCKTGGVGEDEYTVLYYARNKRVHFEGKLTTGELERLTREGSIEVTSIEYDRFKDELIITE